MAGWITALCLLLALTGIGCGKEERGKASGDTFEIEKEFKRGPVTFTLKVDHKEITIADRLRLALEVSAKEEYEVRLPEFGEKLEQFGIVDYSAPSPQLIGEGMVLSKKSYELEPFLSGEYKIPPMKVTFWKKGEEQRHEIESEGLTIQVKSLLPEKVADLRIREIAPPVEFPYSARGWIYGLVAVGVVCASGIVFFLLWRKRRETAEKVVGRAAHEIAYEGLESLLAEKLIEKGRVKEFYTLLSNVLRHYIEDRFSLRAPERTTDEFMADLRSTDLLAPAHKDLLKKFLQHCDIVKFAEHIPTTEEIQKAFDACKQFIVETEAESSPQSCSVESQEKFAGMLCRKN